MIKISEILKVGDIYNDLTVVNLETIIRDRRQQIRVKCKCGKEMYLRPDYLIQGRTKSCYNCSVEKIKGRPTCFVGDLCSKIYNDIKTNAKIRNLDFNVTMQELWDLFIEQDKKCALSGLEIELKLINWNQGKGSRIGISASLDRIDPSKGYSISNVQWVHKWVNIMKGCMSDEQFIFLCNKIAEYNNFEYDNIEPSLMTGWLPRMFNTRDDRSKVGVTTSTLSEPKQ